jgi:hypothetical protein
MPSGALFGRHEQLGTQMMHHRLIPSLTSLVAVHQCRLRRRDHATGSCVRLPLPHELDALRIIRPADGRDNHLHVALGAGDDIVADPLRLVWFELERALDHQP